MKYLFIISLLFILGLKENTPLGNTFPPVADQVNVDKIKEIQRREREINIQRNAYWLNSLAVYYREGRDLDNFMKFNELIDGFSAEAAQTAALKYFDLENMIQVTLNPED